MILTAVLGKHRFRGLDGMKRRRCCVLGISFAYILLHVLFFGCSSVGVMPAEEDGFSVLYDDSDILIYVPAAENKAAVHQLASVLFSDLSPDSVSRIAGRTDAVWIGVSVSDSDVHNSSFQVIASGSFPAAFVKTAFSKKNGWTKTGGVFIHKSGLQAAVPFSGLVLFSGGTVPVSSLLEKMRIPPLCGRFNTEEKNAHFYTDAAHESSVHFYVKNTEAFFYMLIGMRVQFGVDYAAGYIALMNDGECSADIDLFLKDGKAAKPLIFLLSAALKSITIFSENTVSVTQKNENCVSVSGFPLSLQSLFSLIKQAMPY
ncbi:MAG: hypothetical protein NC041_04845 [Bacteroides sp.]|nr:hypothetical protein [Prevotella sp.]MCM1407287.1 hypothetical protein [Treponema brennaborense]MCM1469775.1 hypothetical protein [Bacteroides sp.]